MAEDAARRWMIAAAVAGIALRIAFGSYYWVGKALTHDEREYLALARSLTDGRGFTYDPAHLRETAQQFSRPPAYPAFLAAIGAGREHHNHSPQSVKIAQAFIGGATVWLIGLIALSAAGPRAGVVAAALAAAYPPLVTISAYVLSESVYSAVALLAVYILQLTVKNSDNSGRAKALAIAAGGFVGLAILTRSAMLLYVPLAAIWLMRRQQRRLAVAFVLGALAIMAPWTARNAYVHGRLILVASEGGVNFWIGNHPLAGGEGDLSANPQIKAADVEFRRAHPGLSPEELEPLYYRDALRSIAAQPLQWFVLLLRKLFYTVVPLGPSYTLHSTRYWAASVASYLLVLPLAIIGIGRLWRRESCPTAVLLLAASAVLVGLVFFPQERFRIPVMDPVLIISAGSALRGRGAEL